MVAFADANGRYIALRVRDRQALYAKLDELGKRFGWQSNVIKSGDAQIHHLHIPGIDASNGQPGMDPKVRAWMQLYARIGSNFYWVEDGDYLVFADVPQLLIDRVASKPDTSLGQWLHDNQSFDSVHTVLGLTATTHNMQREVYYSYLGVLQSLGDAMGQPVDLTTMPSAGQLRLPVEGATGLALEATDQRLALQMTYEQSPAEGLVGGGGSTMTTVAVVAILAAIAIPAYQDYVIRSQVGEGAALSEGAKTAVAEYYSNQRADAERQCRAAGLASAASISGAYVAACTVNDGQIHVVYSSHAPRRPIRRWTVGSWCSLRRPPNQGATRSMDLAAARTFPRSTCQLPAGTDPADLSRPSATSSRNGAATDSPMNEACCVAASP